MKTYDIDQSMLDAERMETAIENLDATGKDRLKTYLDRGGLEPVLAEMKTRAGFRFDPALKTLVINRDVEDGNLAKVISEAAMEASMGFNAKHPIVGGEVKKNVVVKPAMGPKNDFKI